MHLHNRAASACGNGAYTSASRVFIAGMVLLGLGAATVLAEPGEPASRPASSADGRTRPNIVLILADDLGWTDLSCTGSRYYETPNIDRLRQEGMYFPQFYVSQNCAPTRACIMTGQYAPRTGVYTVTNLDRGPAAERKMNVPKNVTNLPRDRMTVADAMKSAGYATGMFGKWHLGEKDEYHPSARGFDEAIVSAGRHFNFRTNPRADVPKGEYLADFLTDRAVRFIEKNKDRPFFLYLPHFAVHVPLEAKEKWIEHFKAKPPADGHKNPTYAAMIASLDESVGRVMAKLDDLKLSDKTMVIFLADNGGVGGYAAAGVEASEITDNRPLRSGKGSLYEGGIRVPFIAKYPPMIKPGTTCDTPGIHVDLLPTLVDLAGGQLPKQPLDGVSLVPLFKDAKGSIGRDALYYHFPGYLQGKAGSWRTTPVGVIRQGNFKLMEFHEDGRLELYNLKDDPSEKTNLADKMPEKTRDLRDRLAAWRKDLKAEMPTLKSAKKNAAE